VFFFFFFLGEKKLIKKITKQKIGVRGVVLLRG